jgi:hypothetical protein
MLLPQLVSVHRDRGDLQLAAQGSLVERLNILQDMLKLPPSRRQQVLGQPIKHERIIRIRRMPEPKEASLFRR